MKPMSKHKINIQGTQLYNTSYNYDTSKMLVSFFCVTRVRNAFTHDKKEPLFEAKQLLSIFTDIKIKKIY